MFSTFKGLLLLLVQVLPLLLLIEKLYIKSPIQHLFRYWVWTKNDPFICSLHTLLMQEWCIVFLMNSCILIAYPGNNHELVKYSLLSLQCMYAITTLVTKPQIFLHLFCLEWLQQHSSKEDPWRELGP